MNVRRLREYMILCDYFDIEPTWEGLRSFYASCEIKKRIREAEGNRNGGR